jgi:hypothetical protein
MRSWTRLLEARAWAAAASATRGLKIKMPAVALLALLLGALASRPAAAAPTGWGGAAAGVNPPVGDFCGTTANPVLCKIQGTPVPTPIPSPAAGAAGVIPSLPGAGPAVWANVYTVFAVDVPLPVTGTPAANAVVALFPCNREIDFPASLTGGGAPPLNVSSNTWCVTAPSSADTYTIKGTGSGGATFSTLATTTLPTGCATGAVPTLTGSGSCASGTCVACVAGGAIEAVAPATIHGEATFTFNLAAQEHLQ